MLALLLSKLQLYLLLLLIIFTPPPLSQASLWIHGPKSGVSWIITNMTGGHTHTLFPVTGCFASVNVHVELPGHDDLHAGLPPIPPWMWLTCKKTFPMASYMELHTYKSISLDGLG